jgi:hypothetical protein
MNTNQSDFEEKMEAYLDGALSDEDKLAFETILKEDEELLSRLAFRKNLAIQWNRANEYSQVRSAVGEVIRRDNHKKQKRILFLALAAVLVGLAIIPATLWYSKHHQEGVLFSNNQDDQSQVVPIQADPLEEIGAVFYHSEIDLIAPTGGQCVDYAKPVAFKWNKGLTTDAVITLIYNRNPEQPIHFMVGAGDSVLILESGLLKEGFYSWSIQGISKVDSFMLQSAVPIK